MVLFEAVLLVVGGVFGTLVVTIFGNIGGAVSGILQWMMV